jgi:hypothetical protein
MRNMLLASAALLGLAMAAPAMAQTDTQTGAPAGTGQPTMGDNTGQAMPGDTTGGGSMPGMKPHRMHARAAGHDSGMMPGADASAEQYLTEAQRALQHRRGAMADDALEHAETRLLDRSTAPDAAARPDDGPTIRQISQAREAIGHRDWPAADRAISEALKSSKMAAASGGMSGGGMSGGGMSGGQMNNSGTMGGGTGGSGTAGSDTMPAAGAINRGTTGGSGSDIGNGAGSGNSSSSGGATTTEPPGAMTQ